MRIRTQATLTMLLFGLIVIVISGLIARTYLLSRRIGRQLEITRNLEQGAVELAYLVDDYLLHQEGPQQSRVEARLMSFSDSLSRFVPRGYGQQAEVRAIAGAQKQLEAVFAQATSVLSAASPLDAAAEWAIASLFWSRLQVHIQEMAFEASMLTMLLRQQVDRLGQTLGILVFSFIGSFAIFLLFLYALIYRRTIRSISLLQRGTKLIGTGQLDFSIQALTNDEFGQLTGDFNRMIASLREVTSSKAELEKEMDERRRAQKALQNLNAELEQRVAERTALAESRTHQLQVFAVRLTEAEEEERRRIADLIHDELQQILAAARFQLQAAQASFPASSFLGEVEKLLEDAIGKSRRLSRDLHPAILHHAELYAALQWLANQIKEQYGLEVQLETNGLSGQEQSPLKVLLFRSVQELLFNVVKHAQARSARVSLSDSGHQLTITVSDDGKGIDPGILDPSRAGSAGTGLLSIRERVQALGGSLAIEGTPGTGTCIRLTVPRVSTDIHGVPSQVPAGSRPSTSAEPLLQPTGGVGYRVLFVDDHRVIRQGLIAMLAGQPDIQVVGEASDGAEAVEQAQQLHPDVIVMDVSMPDMDGIEATRRIKALMPEVRVVGLSMHEEKSIVAQMHEAGAEAFVSKTSSLAGLLRAIYGTQAGAPSSES